MERIKILQNKVDELTQWMKDNSDTQISYPLGVNTKKIIRKDLLVATGRIGAGIVFSTMIEVTYNGRTYWLPAIAN